jgi:hypothetical protein
MFGLGQQLWSGVMVFSCVVWSVVVVNSYVVVVSSSVVSSGVVVVSHCGL